MQYPLLLTFLPALLIVVEVVVLGMWVYVFARGAGNREDLLTLDVISTAPHFVCLFTLVDAWNHLHKVCTSPECEAGEPSVSWILPPCISVVYDAFLLCRGRLFYAEDDVFVPFAAFTVAASCANVLWSGAVFYELSGVRRRRRVFAEAEVTHLKV